MSPPTPRSSHAPPAGLPPATGTWPAAPGSWRLPVGVDDGGHGRRDRALARHAGHGEVCQVDRAGDGRGDRARYTDGLVQAGGVQVDVVARAPQPLCHERVVGRRRRPFLCLEVGAGDGRGPGGVVGDGLHALESDRGAAGIDEQTDEEDERRDDDRRLERGRPALPAYEPAQPVHGALTVSTGASARAVICGAKPGRMEAAVPVTVMRATRSPRSPPTDTSVIACCPTSVTKSVAAAMPTSTVESFAPAARAPSWAAAMATVCAW